MLLPDNPDNKFLQGKGRLVPFCARAGDPPGIKGWEQICAAHTRSGNLDPHPPGDGEPGAAITSWLVSRLPQPTFLWHKANAISSKHRTVMILENS